MTVNAFIERVRRQIYNGLPSDDATITVGLVKNYLPDAIAAAVKANYKDNIAIDGIGYMNNSFYTRFTDISITPVSNFTLWKLNLPEIPVGLGANEGISVMELKDSDGNITRPFVALSENQRSFYQSMQPIPNKVLYYYEGKTLYILSTLMLNQYTANVTMVSGGDLSLSSELNVPADYYSFMMQYLQQQLLLEKNQPKDVVNDGEDFVQTT